MRWTKTISLLAIGLSMLAATAKADDANLTARCVFAEACGVSFQAKVWVAATIINRADHPSYPNDIRGVIYQKNAFSSVMENSRLWRMSANPASMSPAYKKKWNDCVKAVNIAMESRNLKVIAFKETSCPTSKYFRSLVVLAVFDNLTFYGERE